MSTATAFCSVAAADDVLAAVSGTDAWGDLDSVTKGLRIIEATNLLDGGLRWSGWRRWPTKQRLAFPRSGLFTRDGEWINDNIVPDWLVTATALLAQQLSVGAARTLRDIGVAQSVSMGNLAVTYDTSRFVPPIGGIPEGVLQLVRPYIRVTVPVLRA